MIRLAVTQRVELVADYGERRDCLDQQWTRLLEFFGLDLLPVPNNMTDPEGWVERQEVGGLLLTGGNDLSHLPKASRPSPERDVTERALLGWAAKLSLPVLGVCRGMQMINHFLHGSMVPITGHVACIHSIHLSSEATPLDGSHEVNSFHSWGIEEGQLGEGLRGLAWCEAGNIEAFRHRRLPWLGIMWHPERERQVSKLDELLIRQLFSNM